MFESLTKIPITETDMYLYQNVLNEISTELKKTIDTSKWYLSWNKAYELWSLGQLMVITMAMAKDKTRPAKLYYLDDDYYSLSRLLAETEYHGIVINQAPSTHFNLSDYPKEKFLLSAEEHLKQSPQHFIKIFTIEESDNLAVWTNKPLEPKTLVKLVQLHKALYPTDNPILDAATQAFLDEDVTAFKKAYIDYLTSDAVVEAEFKMFSACIANNTDAQIRQFQKNIDAERSNITYWENEITQSAAKIRDMNEKIDFLRTKHDDDSETRMLFKFLKKNPYIKKFKPVNNNKIHLQYEAPIIYFSDLPAEKYLTKDYVSGYKKNIIKIFLGRKYELMTKCALYFDTSNFRVEFSSRSLDIETTAFPHPHIMRFSCFGNHGEAIRQAAEEGNYLGAIEQISQAVMNLNFYDSCVVDEMLRNIEEHMHRTYWREKETGLWYTTKQVLERNDYYEEA